MANRRGRTAPYRQRDEAGARRLIYISMAIVAVPAVRVGLQVYGASRVLTPLGILAFGANMGNGCHAAWSDMNNEYGR